MPSRDRLLAEARVPLECEIAALAARAEARQAMLDHLQVARGDIERSAGKARLRRS